MTIIPADAHTSQTDLLLADGSVVFQDAWSAFWVALPDGTERRLGSRFDAPVQPVVGYTSAFGTCNGF